MTQTAAGSALAISAAAPATQDAAGYGALTFTDIGNISEIGGIGATYAKVDWQPLKGAKEKLKGSADYGSLSPTVGVDDTDAGQTLLRTAADNETNLMYSFKATLQDGSKRFFQARVFGFQETIGGADSVVTAQPSIEICKKVVKVAAS